jgi:hypothetical protein
VCSSARYVTVVGDVWLPRMVRPTHSTFRSILTSTDDLPSTTCKVSEIGQRRRDVGSNHSLHDPLSQDDCQDVHRTKCNHLCHENTHHAVHICNIVTMTLAALRYGRIEAIEA